MRYNTKKSIYITFLIILGCSIIISCSKSKNTLPEDIKDKSIEFSDNVKEVYDDTKDEICEMINGKLECTKRRIKSDFKDLVDNDK